MWYPVHSHLTVVDVLQGNLKIPCRAVGAEVCNGFDYAAKKNSFLYGFYNI
jgi:hypothetical protein